jgi:glycosyltransferase involved in cell wall biosynthesis
VSAPRVSVVVPTAGRPAQLARCLAALRAQDEPDGGFEIVVAIDGDETTPDPDGARVVRHARRRGPGAARNTGAVAARGEVLAFTDDDCVPDRGWLAALLAGLGPGAAVGGRTVNALGANRFADASQHIVDLVYAHYNRDERAARFLASNNLAVRRDDFLAVGGFDAGAFPFASEDRDLCDRWRASGRTLRLVPEAVVRHAHELDLAGFVAQHLAYGRGAARYHRARRARGTGRLRDDLPFHLDPSLYVHTARLRPRRRAARVAALLPLWQAANAAGYALEGAAMNRFRPHG